jgi:gluconolactonase
VSPVPDSLIDPSAQLEKLGEGYQVTEGPVWVPAENCLYFCDIPGDTRWRWTRENGMEISQRPSFKANGTCLDIEGNLITCEQVTSCVVRYHADGRREILAYHHRGTYLNSPNDIVVRSDGGIYFTDPDFGRWNDWIGQQRSKNGVGFRGVYRVGHEGGGEAELLVAEDEFDQPNGLCFSPDESILYVNDSPRGHIKAFDVGADGTLSGGRVLADGIGGMTNADGVIEVDARERPHAPDGMECDALGNLWTTGPGGVWVTSPTGEHLGVLETPEHCKSLVWGGEDGHTLFLMTETSVHAVPTVVGPVTLPPYR